MSKINLITVFESMFRHEMALFDRAKRQIVEEIVMNPDTLAVDGGDEKLRTQLKKITALQYKTRKDFTRFLEAKNILDMLNNTEPLDVAAILKTLESHSGGSGDMCFSM